MLARHRDAESTWAASRCPCAGDRRTHPLAPPRWELESEECRKSVGEHEGFNLSQCPLHSFSWTRSASLP
jgi:hypothetical protein